MHARLMNVVMVVLLALAIAELVLARRAGKKVHTLRDTASSIAMGIGQQTLNVYLASTFLGAYTFVHARTGLFAPDRGTWWHWALLVVGCDLAFYWGHRTAHNVNLFVAGHVPHHQAEDYNLPSSLRQGWGAWVQMFPFYLPLAVLGYPIEMLIQGQIGVMCFQFLSHYGASRVRLGVLDRIFVTPKNHHVHHGFGRRYGGKNCGGMLVVWDRLFGTYAEEDPAHPVEVGNGLAVDFYAPLESHLDYYRRIWTVARSRRGVGKVTIWFQSPGTLYRELEGLSYRSSVVNRAPLGRADVRRILAATALCVVVFFAHRALFERSSVVVRVLTGATTIGSLLALGALLSGKSAFTRQAARPAVPGPAHRSELAPAHAHPLSSSMRAA